MNSSDADPPAKQWFDEHITTATWQTVAFGGAVFALGVWFGNNITGRLVTAERSAVDILTNGQPEWVATVETLNWAALGAFVVGILLVVALDAIGGEAEDG